MDTETFQNTDTNIYKPRTPLAKTNKQTNKKQQQQQQQKNVKKMKFTGRVQRIDEF